MAQINKPTDYFNTLLYIATGTQSVTGAGFQPDMSWVKARSTTSGHYIADAIRGSTKTIRPDSTAVEGTQNLITSFDSDGVSLGSANWSDSRTAVIWNWKANGVGSANTDGTISSTVSANTTSGFSIVSYTGNGSAGATVGHGLGAVPKMMIVRNRTSVTNWHVYHEAIGATKYLHLNLTNAEGTASSVWNNTAPTSSVFSIGSGDGTNKNTDNIIAYCFAEKKGYSKFSSYTGNGNADGTFVYTGFKPAFVIVKRTDTAGNSWFMWDNKRATYNEMVNCLIANTTNAELTDREIDFLSNGFKTRANDGNYNASGGTYIYMAFAENPLVGTNNIPATAR